MSKTKVTVKEKSTNNERAPLCMSMVFPAIEKNVETSSFFFFTFFSIARLDCWRVNGNLGRPRL